MVNYNPTANSNGDTSDGITFATNRRPRTHKEKSKIVCFRYGVSGHYSIENSCKQEGVNKYNATNKSNETINKILSENNYKRITDTPVEDNGTQMLMAGLKIDDFDEFNLLPDVPEQ